MATISNAILASHFRQAKRSGYLRPELLVESGLDLASVKSGVGRSDAAAFAKWLSNMWQENDDEAGGFLARPVKSGTFAMSMHALISAGNLRRAFLRSGQFYRLVNDGILFQLNEQGEEAHLTLKVNAPLSEDLCVFYDALLVLWLRWASWMIDRPILLNRVHIPFQAPAYENEYQYMYHCHVFTEQNDCRAVFPVHYLNAPIVKAPQDLPEFLSQAPEILLVEYQQQNSVSSQVIQQFSKQNLADGFDQNAIAKQLGVSSVTLRRQLKAEGHSFQDLKDQWRRKHAMHLLRTGSAPLHQISQSLGFSEPSAFSRAFKKWTGLNPGDVR